MSDAQPQVERRLAVLGAGTMGAGIAQLAAQRGFDVLLYDVKQEFVDRGLENARNALQKRVDAGKLSSGDMSAALARIAVTTNRDDAAAWPLVIEAAPEDIALKRDIFAALDKLSEPETVLATNTSSLSITSIAAAAARPERVVGMHFFNPAPALPLVEVIAGHRTSPGTVENVMEVARALGKTPVLSSDSPGFIVNRVARPFYGEALKMLGEGSAGVEEIDRAMLGAGFKMGPFELMDLIGIDINFAVTKSVHEAFFGEPRYRPHPIQQRMVESGEIGRKAGRGFYDYLAGARGEVAYRRAASAAGGKAASLPGAETVKRFLRAAGIEGTPGGEVVARILAMIINEAAFALGEGVASAADIDTAMKLGTNYPHGPLEWADEIGLPLVIEVLRSLQIALGEERYRPAPLLLGMVASGAVGVASRNGFRVGTDGVV